MDDRARGEALRSARRRKGIRTQAELGDLVDRSARTIRNYESGAPIEPAVLDALIRLLGDFTGQGDAVEQSVRESELVKWRQDAVLTEYERHKYEQAREASA